MAHNMQKPVSVILFLSAGLLALLSAGCSRQARTARHLEQANKYFASGQYDQAEVEYLNVLQIERINPDAIAGLGLIYSDQGRIERALPFLIRAQQLRPDDLDVRLRLGRLLLEAGNLKAALDAANFVLDRRKMIRRLCSLWQPPAQKTLRQPANAWRVCPQQLNLAHPCWLR
jgi:tetratricopeptide (TPR) repeat protein